MQQTEHNGRVLTVANLREYFHDALQGALAHQHVAVEDQTEHYVVNLLTLFSRSEQLFEHTRRTACGSSRWCRCCPMHSRHRRAQERERGLQRLGDVSLFIAGFFAHSFARKLIDIDYHIAMGGRAYGTLAGGLCRGRRQVLGRVFAELAAKFQPLVDALNEISDAARRYTPGRCAAPVRDLAQDRQSARACSLLRGLGIEATPVALASN